MTAHPPFDWTTGELPVTLASAAHGDIDEPRDGAVCTGDVLAVSGWCLFEGTRVARVELFINGRMVGVARHHIDRMDIAATFPDCDAPVAGFRAHVVLPDEEVDTELVITIRATSLDGRQWISPTRRVPRHDRLVASADVELADRFRRDNAHVYARICNERSRLLIATHDLSYGGGQLWLLDLLRQALAETHREWLLVAQADGPLRTELEAMGMTVHVNSGAQVGNPAAYEGHVHELALLMQAHSVGAVLVNTLGIFSAVDAASRLGIPSLWAIHESFPTPLHRYYCWHEGIHPYVARQYDKCFALASGLVFEAGQTADLFRHLMPDNRAFVVDYGIELDEIDRFRTTRRREALRRSAGFGPGDTVLLVVGTFEARKAQGLILAAFDELAAVHETAHLVLMGTHPAPFCDAIAEQVRRSDHSDRVHLIPVGPDVYSWYHIADLLVCASDVESLPRSMLQAMAFGLPIVSTDVFGIPNIIKDGVTGWLTRANDLEGLVGTLHLVLSLPAEELREAGRRGRELVEKRMVEERYGRRIGAALEALLADPGTDLAALLSSWRARHTDIGGTKFHRRTAER